MFWGVLHPIIWGSRGCGSKKGGKFSYRVLRPRAHQKVYLKILMVPRRPKRGDNKWKGLIEKAIENKTPEKIEAKEETELKTRGDYWV